MKKLFTLLLAVAASVGTVFAWDYERVQIGDLYYNLDATNQTAEVTSQYSSYPYWSTTITTANIPASVTYNSVSYSVTSIGDYAFYYCTGLTSVTIPNSVTSIGGFAFLGSTGLTSIEIPNSVTSIGYQAFTGCSGLTSVIVENGNSFYDSRNNCNAIIETATNTLIVGCMNTIIPNSVTSIGDGAFLGCTGLTSIEIPNSVTSIGYGAFADCTGLTSVTIPNSVTSIGESAFQGCSGLTYVTIPNSVTSIGNQAFSFCSGLTSPVYNAHVFAYMPTSNSGAYTIPDGIESIAGCAFLECSGLTSVTIPNSVTSIGSSAFGGCSGLTSVTIPNSVTSIGSGAFAGCSGLTSITCKAITPPTLGSYVFYDVNKSIPLYVPAGSIDLYKAADQWKDFSNILPIGAQPADVTTTIVTPSATTADIAWPQVTGAATYTIEIKKNGELICTLTFNAQGQLISITFAAPSRNNAPQQTQAAGFAFTVTSLDSGTTYSYTMTAKDSSGNVLKTESGSFTTTGDAQGFEDVQGNNVQCTKIVHNGQIFILRGEHVYDTEGKMVK